MLLTIIKASFLAALLAWGVLHLTESLMLTGLAAATLMALRLANLVPFATAAVPVGLAAFLLLHQGAAPPSLRDTLATVHGHLGLVGVALAERAEPPLR